MFSRLSIPIRRKLMIISLAASGTALLLACTAFVTYEQLTFRQHMTRDLSVTARIIGSNSTAALAFHDPVAAGQTLQALAEHPHVMAAAVYDEAGELFATYLRDNEDRSEWPAFNGESEDFSRHDLRLFRNIHLGDEIIGAIYLQSDLRQITERWQRYALIVAAVLMVSTFLAWLVSSRLQRIVSSPIRHLAGVADRVSGQQDYSIRATKQSEDEIGHLTDSFNEMLARMEAQNRELEGARKDLEHKVNERTRELREAKAKVELERATFKFIFDNVPVGISLITWDCHENAVSSYLINDAHLQICGVPPERRSDQLVFKEFTHPEDAARQQKFQDKLDTGEIDHYTLEKRYIRPDGTIVWTIFSTRRRFFDDGSAQNLTTIIDITERKQAVEELDKTHKRLLAASRQAGMAEVATSVLHNVGNVLNSVNVSATVLADRVRQSRGSSLTKLSALLGEHKNNLAEFLTRDKRGVGIPAYIEKLAQHLGEERSDLLNELKSLRSNIDHIKEIVAMQQSYATVSGMKENVSLVELVEDALRLQADSLTRHEVEIKRDFQAEPLITTERHKVLQILVNLLRNAKQACEASSADPKRITVRITENNGSVELSVIDNGVGILPENRDRIFSHGFTTRKDGHGFGLHGGALAAHEMGGTLHGHSDGPDRGATFTLSLPQ